MEVQGNSGAGTRLMTDFLVPKSAVINYTLNSGDFSPSNAGFSELLPQTITFDASPSTVRWSRLVANQPIYNFRVRATALVFNWDTMLLEETMIPLPLAAEYNIKLLFATRSEVPVTEG
jgi:hypothetical protein